MEPTLTTRLSANGVVPWTLGSYLGSVPVLLPGPAPWTAPGPTEAERAAQQLFSPLQHAERGAGPCF